MNLGRVLGGTVAGLRVCGIDDVAWGIGKLDVAVEEAGGWGPESGKMKERTQFLLIRLDLRNGFERNWVCFRREAGLPGMAIPQSQTKGRRPVTAPGVATGLGVHGCRAGKMTERTQFLLSRLGLRNWSLRPIGFASGGGSPTLTSDRAEMAELREAAVPSAKRGAWGWRRGDGSGLGVHGFGADKMTKRPNSLLR